MFVDVQSGSKKRPPKKLLSKEERETEREKVLKKPRNFPNFFDAYIEFTKDQESTVKIHKWVAVSILAAAMERKCFLDVGHFKIHPNFYIFIIGNSGEVRKSTSTGIGFDLVRATGTIQLMSERLTDRSLIDQMERSKAKYYTGNAEFYGTQSAVYAYASELVVFLREVAGKISELLTTVWDCPPVWTYETHEEEIILEGPCLNILGASTPTWLQRAIPAEEMEGGLASRIVFVVEMKPPDRYNAWGAPNTDALKELRAKLVEDLKRISYLRGNFTYTEAAKDFYEKWYSEHRQATGKIKDIRFKGYYSRKPVTVWKLAMVLAVAESDDLCFDQRHLETALEWLNELEESMMDAFGQIGGNKLARGKHQALGLLVAAPERRLKEPELVDALYAEFTSAETKQIITDLQQGGNVRIYASGSTRVVQLTEGAFNANSR